MPLPVSGDLALGTRNRLGQRVRMGRSQLRPFGVLLGAVIPEPVLAGLKALDHAVFRVLGMRGRMLAGGIVAAADMPALGAPP